jgi:hypothetical protein
MTLCLIRNLLDTAAATRALSSRKSCAVSWKTASATALPWKGSRRQTLLDCKTRASDVRYEKYGSSVCREFVASAALLRDISETSEVGWMTTTRFNAFAYEDGFAGSCAQCLQCSIGTFRLNMIHHSDQGTRHTSIAFAALRKAGVRLSMCSVADCYVWSQNRCSIACEPLGPWV